MPEPLWPKWMPDKVDVESLIGRYGTLVLATVSALAAVGTFLGWAIAQGLLGPAQRIGLGLLLATALAVGGMRLRPRERSFGASLLGLALAIVHVCAWGAGPSLHLVPAWAAFLLAAVASIGLAIFAHRERDEPLWCVGFSGAAVAPFVTSSGRGNFVLLAAYGLLVLTTAGYAMSGRRWMIAGRVFLVATAAYVTALAVGAERQFGPLLAMGLPLFVAVAGVIPWTTGWARRDRLRAMGALAALAALRVALATNLPLSAPRIAALIAAAGLVWLILLDRTHLVRSAPPTAKRPHEGDWVDAGVLPMAFALAALAAFDASARVSGIAMAAAAGVLLVTVARFPAGALRDAAVFAAVLSALIAELFLLRGRGEMFVVAVAALSTACFAGALRWPSVSWTVLALTGLAWSALASLVNLSTRPEYQYTPFGTSETAVAAVVFAAIAASLYLARAPRVVTTLRAAVVVWGFVWVHQEIAFAVNATVATLLRVTYYAATSVAAVGVGRERGHALLRHAGLGLGILAAATALWGARRLDAIAARIVADLVAAVFLLGIAYWYRTPGGTARRSATA